MKGRKRFCRLLIKKQKASIATPKFLRTVDIHIQASTTLGAVAVGKQQFNPHSFYADLAI